VKRCAVDANVILRFLTGGPADLASQPSALFEAADRHELTLAIDEIAVAETVWVLQSFYDYGHRDITRVVQELLSHPGLEAKDKPGLLLALYLFAEKNVDFADALVAIHMRRRGLADVHSLDRHFDQLRGVTGSIPGQDSHAA